MKKYHILFAICILISLPGINKATQCNNMEQKEGAYAQVPSKTIILERLTKIGLQEFINTSLISDLADKNLPTNEVYLKVTNYLTWYHMEATGIIAIREITRMKSVLLKALFEEHPCALDLLQRYGDYQPAISQHHNQQNNNPFNINELLIQQIHAGKVTLPNKETLAARLKEADLQDFGKFSDIVNKFADQSMTIISIWLATQYNLLRYIMQHYSTITDQAVQRIEMDLLEVLLTSQQLQFLTHHNLYQPNFSHRPSRIMQQKITKSTQTAPAPACQHTLCNLLSYYLKKKICCACCIHRSKKEHVA